MEENNNEVEPMLLIMGVVGIILLVWGIINLF